MTMWEIIITTVGGASITAGFSAISYVYGRIGKLEERTAVLETQQRIEFGYMKQSIEEIKSLLKRGTP